MMAIYLGKTKPVLDKRTYKLAPTLLGRLSSPPDSVDYGTGISYPTWRNCDTLNPDGSILTGLSCCTQAAANSAILTWSSNANSPIVISNSYTVFNYSICSGYVPGEPETDNGDSILNVLNFWRTSGIYKYGNQVGNYVNVLSAFGYLNPLDINSIKRAIALLGGVSLGFMLPSYAVNLGVDWEIDNSKSPAIVGGHNVFAHGYTKDYLLLNTWGVTIRVSWEFFTKYCDEAYGLVSRTWLSTNNLAPNKLSYDQLIDSLRK